MEPLGSDSYLYGKLGGKEIIARLRLKPKFRFSRRRLYTSIDPDPPL
jgi:hypothetical protein